jgi:hypothetical protein
MSRLPKMSSAGSFPMVAAMKSGIHMNNNMHIEHNPMRRRAFSVWSLAMATIIGIGAAAGPAAVNAQATASNVFGIAPAGDTVTAKSNISRLSRQVKVDAEGRYSIRSLPVGVYTVTLEKDGNAVEQHDNVPLTVGRSSKVDFPCPQNQCAESASHQ